MLLILLLKLLYVVTNWQAGTSKFDDISDKLFELAITFRILSISTSRLLSLLPGPDHIGLLPGLLDSTPTSTSCIWADVIGLLQSSEPSEPDVH